VGGQKITGTGKMKTVNKFRYLGFISKSNNTTLSEQKKEEAVKK
jgi:hypothetical protein